MSVPDQKPVRMKTHYQEVVLPGLTKKFQYKNPYQAPRLVKVVLNVGLGEAVENVKLLDTAVDEMAAITGQKPVITRATKSISNFKIRQGMPIGCKVTLRGNTMYEFLDRLISVSLPRIRDFRGISPRAFDGQGNYTLGLKEQLIFPEIDADKTPMVHGMDITVVTTAKTNDECQELLKLMGIPFQKPSEESKKKSQGGFT